MEKEGGTYSIAKDSSGMTLWIPNLERGEEVPGVSGFTGFCKNPRIGPWDGHTYSRLRRRVLLIQWARNARGNATCPNLSTATRCTDNISQFSLNLDRLNPPKPKRLTMFLLPSSFSNRKLPTYESICLPTSYQEGSFM